MDYGLRACWLSARTRKPRSPRLSSNKRCDVKLPRVAVVQEYGPYHHFRFDLDFFFFFSPNSSGPPVVVPATAGAAPSTPDMPSAFGVPSEPTREETAGRGFSVGAAAILASRMRFRDSKRLRMIVDVVLCLRHCSR